ncbi:uncharacterized protein LOC133186050 [Saccostrea echinata]|uniref:uncharacterized protein LOC133186050 n=1 Tax=Saccostrea echinata TaxID=191078 RepID=UPI002A8207BA|nr:uncharacterized protein LOC133186050 [Saccostrea echinata]
MVYTVNGLYRDSVANSVSVETVQKRRRALKKLRILSIASIIVSFCNIPVGIVVLTHRGDMEFPLTSGAPIWSGALVLACSIHGLKVSWMEVEYEHVPSPRASLHLKAYHNINRVSVLTSLACIAFSAVFVLYCGRDSYNPESCPTSEREEMISNILAMSISVIMMICSIMGIILLRLNGKALGLKKLLEIASEENRNARQEQSEDITENTSQPQRLRPTSYDDNFPAPTAPPLCIRNFPDPYAPPQYDSYFERVSEENRNDRLGQTEETTRRDILENLELQPRRITDIDNRITDFENTSHPQRLGPPPYHSNFPDPSAPPPYERNSSDPTEFEYRYREFQNTSHSQRFGLPPYDNNDSDLTENYQRTTDMEINPQRLEPPLYDSSIPTPPYECNRSDPTEIDYRNPRLQNNSNPQRLGLPSYDDVSNPTEIGSRTTEFENNSPHQNVATPVDYNSIDLTEPPPTYEEYMRNL